MSRLSEIQQILTDAVNGQEIGGHGKWWEGLSRDEFVQYRVFEQKVVEVGNAEDSLLIHSLEARGLFARPMPIGFPPVSAEKIGYIRKWIDEGCPDD